jgi:aryl-alcohol dehydrogenase-like predicted oxidoreductase
MGRDQRSMVFRANATAADQESAASGLSRRMLLKAGLAAPLALGLGGVLGAPPLWAQSSQASSAKASSEAGGGDLSSLPLITKPIPSTGEHLPVVGLGTDKFRNGERAAIRQEIARMQQLGGTVIDTSADYGDSEALVGETLATLRLRDRMFVATKLVAGGSGFLGVDVGGRPSFERSLKRLRTARVDLLQVHNLDGVDELVPLLRDLKQAGMIRYYGITSSEVGQHAEMVGYLRKYPLDFVQVDYSIANRDAANDVLPLALDRRVAVLINVPFGYGETIQQAQSRRLPPWAADIDVHSWGQYLLKYVISHPAVTCAIPGSTQVRHLEDNQGAARGRLPDAAMRRRMEQYRDAG